MADVDRDLQRLMAVLAGRPVDWEKLAESDWARLLALAVPQGIVPLVHARLNEHGVAAPPAIAEALRHDYLASAAHNVRLLEELGRILRSLRDARIQVIVLKGACLAEAVYGNFALRPMGDVDPLVRSADVADALEILRALGYVPETHFDAVAEQTINNSVQLRRAGGLRVDLHWTIMPSRFRGGFGPDDLDGLWVRAEPVTVAGVPVLMLSPTDLLLHLCIHLSVDHAFDGVGLRPFLDLSEVQHRFAGAIDWERFAERANTWGVAGGVRLALQLGTEFIGLDVPAGVMSALDAEPADEATWDWVRHKVFHGSPTTLQSDFAPFGGTLGLRDIVRLVRDGTGPFRAALAAMFRAPGASLRSLRVYSGRLVGYLGRNARFLWRIARRDRTLIDDARKEARLREYVGWR